MSYLKLKSLSVVVCAVLVGACSKSSDVATQPSQQAQQAQQQANTGSLPQANFNTPDTAYVMLTDSTQLMYLYAAFSGMPPDYDRMASAMSQDYRSASDEFKKHDMLAALKPKIDAGIADAKAHPYVIFNDNRPQIGHYDFQRKAFPVGDALFQANGYVQLPGPAQYELTVTNGQVFQQLHVPDESLAKTVEALVSQNTNFSLRIYAFVQSTDDSSSPVVKAQITKVDLLGANGQVLLQVVTPH